MFGVSASCVVKLMQRYEATGDCRPDKFGGYKRPILTGREDEVRSLVAARPGLTVTALWRELTARGIEVGRSSVSRFVRRLQPASEKSGARRRAEGPALRPAAPGGASLEGASI